MYVVVVCCVCSVCCFGSNCCLFVCLLLCLNSFVVDVCVVCVMLVLRGEFVMCAFSLSEYYLRC